MAEQFMITITMVSFVIVIHLSTPHFQSPFDIQSTSSTVGQDHHTSLHLICVRSHDMLITGEISPSNSFEDYTRE